MRHFLLAVLLVVAWATGAVAGPLEDANSAIQRGDFTLGMKLLRPLAEQGDAQAQSNLGGMYMAGQGVPQDEQAAVQWWRKAAAQGDAAAQYNLGVSYQDGRGVPQDSKEAVQWWRKAAAQGDGQAQVDLGVMYVKGQGVPQDVIRAFMWFSVAGTASSYDVGRVAMNYRDRVVSKMTAAQIAKAQEMARRCQETKFKECD